MTTVPAVFQPVVINWGDFATQFLKNAEPILAQLAAAGAEYAVGQLPFGAFLSGFIGPAVVSQYVSQAITALEGQLSSLALSISPANFLENTVFTMIKSELPELAAFLNTGLLPMIKAEVAKVLAKV